MPRTLIIFYIIALCQNLVNIKSYMLMKICTFSKKLGLLRCIVSALKIMIGSKKSCVCVWNVICNEILENLAENFIWEFFPFMKKWNVSRLSVHSLNIKCYWPLLKNNYIELSIYMFILTFFLYMSHFKCIVKNMQLSTL